MTFSFKAPFLVLTWVQRTCAFPSSSGNRWESAQALYNITIIYMCIHMHHSDTHLDHVIYSMGALRAIVISTSLPICCHWNQVACFYHVRSLVTCKYIWSKIQPLLNVIKCISNIYVLTFLFLMLLIRFISNAICWLVVNSLMQLSLVTGIFVDIYDQKPNPD